MKLITTDNFSGHDFNIKLITTNNYSGHDIVVIKSLNEPLNDKCPWRYKTDISDHGSLHRNTEKQFWSRLFFIFCVYIGLGLWCLTPISTIFQLYCGVSFIGGRNRSIRRKPPIYDYLHQYFYLCICSKISKF